MKKALVALAALGLAWGAPAGATPEQDLKQFQSYFKKKFPDVAFDDFRIGIYALDADLKAQYDAVQDFPPYELGLENGKQLWETPFKNGRTYASCFKNGGKDIAQYYPYWDEKTNQLKTVEQEINECRVRNGEKPYDNLAKGPLADVTAYMRSLSKGNRVKIDLSNPKARAAYEEGKKFYWSRRGQLNFACAHCHIDNAGKNLGGNQLLSASLGHGVGWPAYRPAWGELRTLHERYATCNKQVRAKPMKHQSPEYKALELYEMYLNSGLPLDAPSLRN